MSPHRLSCLRLVLVLACVLCARTGASELHVDPVSGVDTQDGRSAATAFRTIARAIEQLSGADNPTAGEVHVFLHAGVHELSGPLVLSEGKLLRGGRSVSFEACAGERVVVSGGRRVQGWTLHDAQQNIWKAPAPWKAEEQVRTRHLYVNGRRAVRARSAGGLPNCELLTETDASGEFRDEKDVICVGHRTTAVEMLGWRNPHEIEFVYQKLWTSPRAPVERLERDGAGVRVVMRQPALFWVNNKGMTSPRNAPVFIENALELLDQEGEFYLDSATATFFYKPRPDEDLARAEVVAPVLERLLRIEGGGDGTPKGSLRFVGIRFWHTTWTVPQEHGFPDAQNAVTRRRFSREGKQHRGNSWRYETFPHYHEFIEDGAVTLVQGRNVAFEGCEFSRLGYIGVLVRSGSHGLHFVGNRFDDISSTALQIGDEYDRTDPGTYYPSSGTAIIRDVTVRNNRITRAGAEYYSASGIAWVYPQDLQIVHNEISDLPYSGLHGGWGWAWVGGADRAAARGLTDERRPPTKRLRVENNYIHDVALRLEDSGMIYLLGETSGASPEDVNIISGNFLQHAPRTYGAIYPDEGSSYYRIENNVIEDAPRWLHIWKDSIHDIVLVDNHSNISAAANKGLRTSVTNLTLYAGKERSAEAERIIRSAGLEPEFRKLLHERETN
jgi:hypothetical protein